MKLVDECKSIRNQFIITSLFAITHFPQNNNVQFSHYLNISTLNLQPWPWLIKDNNPNQ